MTPNNIMEMNSMAVRIEREMGSIRPPHVISFVAITENEVSREFDLTTQRDSGSREQARAMMEEIRDKTITESVDASMLDDVDIPRGIDAVKYKWYWAIIIKSYMYWFTLSDFYGVDNESFGAFSSRVFSAYDDDMEISEIGNLLSIQLFNAWLNALRAKVIQLNQNDLVRGRSTAGLGSSDSNEPPRSKKKYKQISSVADNQSKSHMPNVWGYSKGYFELQKGIKDRVLQYLIHMGYENAVQSFLKETTEDASGKSNNNYNLVADTTADAEYEPVDLKEVFDNWGQKDDATHSLIHMGADIEEIKFRKTIKQLICSGRIEKAINLISETYPEILERFPSVKFSLWNLELIERIKRHLSDEIKGEQKESEFLRHTSEFVKAHLSDPEILKYPHLVAKMEDTMTLLCFGRKEEEIPEHLKKQLFYEAKIEVAKKTNDALMCCKYNYHDDALLQISRMLAWSFGAKSSLSQTASVMLRMGPNDTAWKREKNILH